MYTVNWNCSKNEKKNKKKHVYVIGEYLLVVFFLPFALVSKNRDCFLILFITVYCVHMLRISARVEVMIENCNGRYYFLYSWLFTAE